jgi:hypothetical protein
MKRFFGYSSAILLSIFLTACASTPPVNPRPVWIENPGNGVSASAGMHVKGRAAQEELAIERARLEYAKRFGVSVDANQIVTTNVANGRAYTTSSSTSNEETKQTDVKAMVKAKWRDDDADVLYVWLVPAN